MVKRFLPIALFAAAFLAGPAVSPGPAQTQPAPAGTPFKMTIENIMRGNDLVGTEPTGVGWSADGSRLYFRWKKPAEKQAELYFITKTDLTPKKTTAEEMQKVPMLTTGGARGGGFGAFGGGGGLEFSKDRKKALTNQGGDIGLLDLATGKTLPLITTDARESNVKFARGDKKIVFTSEDNLYLYSLEDRSLRQMTSFTRRTAAPAPPARKPDESGKWYTDQQLELFQQFRQGLDRGGMRGEGMMMGMGQRGGGPGAAPASRRRPFTLEENQAVMGLDLSPDEKSVLFNLSEPNANERSTIVPNYVTRSGFTEDITGRAKAGYASRSSKAGLMDVGTGDVKWVDYGQPGRTVLPGGVLLVARRKDVRRLRALGGPEGRLACDPRPRLRKDGRPRAGPRRRLDRRAGADEHLLVAGQPEPVLHLREGRLRPSLQDLGGREDPDAAHVGTVRSPRRPPLPGRKNP